MTKKAPQWQRRGHASEADYRAACAATRQTRKAAMLATGTKLGTLLILEKMWSRAEFDKPQATVTKEQLMADTGVCLRTVKKALTDLRAEGSIKPIRNIKGGRSLPTTWRLCVAGAKASPADEQIDGLKAARERDATWRFLSQKYGAMKALEIMGGR